MALHDTHGGVAAPTAADRLVAATNAASVLVVGGPDDDLATAFAARGAEVRTVESGDAPEGRADLVVCLDVAETLPPAQAQTLLDHLCSAGDRVVFRSSATAHADPIRVNVQPPAAWAHAFAVRGFFRRADVNLDFLGREAVLFERADLDGPALVHRYESLLAPAVESAGEKTSALLEAHRTIASLREEITTLKLGGPDPDKVARLTDELAALHDEVSRARYDQLTVRDHIIGLEAENERLTGDLDRARARSTSMRTRIEQLKKQVRRQQRTLRRLRTELAGQRQANRARTRELAQLRSSRTWRVGRAVVRPFSFLRR